ncbi:2-keto-4-pentenoate hydratase/2-oxohepta-3-ene-1,7-dioic acid hydratase (catechol pathway) [Noviherbaspirillum humi]|uniref:2-keto-4-pentenoate hydratase/2-oxohepta-3-ene-1,7-dioic acid hydratase (Catechol pathway) n=1 Tax=Noviherbaspirillum humi TaxID=1688639 RepID=A0A239HVK1_9BURK|nr:fumarylacetoacetate hydrolase family protein [Noviherbaspirillum humi]SNS84204.1 2-keto-4-pentenoate hydratase/2-oxohepta-3-ene-1,7-dioic acid hydratase (catechol pathway) [Noviherbaspirillum humi]
MKICRYDDNRLGVIVGDTVRDVTAALDVIPLQRYPLPRHDLLIAHLDAVRARIEALMSNASEKPLAQVRLLAPVANPGKIVAAPVNYRKHLDEARDDAGIHHQNAVLEIQKVGLFLKATSSLVGPSEGVAIEHPERRNDHEVELVAVIAKAGRNIRPEEALSHVAGYAIGLDMTTRGPEERSLRKSIDSYSVVGPWLVTADEIADPASLDLALDVNGEPRQRANTRDLIIGLPELIAFASSFYSLQPGDLLFTGTPEGVGPVKAEDEISAEIGGIGCMRVKVRSARS